MYFGKKSDKQETPHKIIDALFLGNSMDAQKKDHLSKINVKYILVVGNFLTANFPNVK